MAKSVAEILSDIDELLAAAEESSVEALKPIMAREPLEGQVFACLLLLHTEYHELMYNAYINKDGKLHIQYGCAAGFDSQDSFLPSVSTYFFTVVASQERAEKVRNELMSLHKEQFLVWFKKIWWAAGGAQAKIPVYFGFGGEPQIIDIQTGVAMSEFEAAQKLGYTFAGIN